MERGGNGEMLLVFKSQWAGNRVKILSSPAKMDRSSWELREQANKSKSLIPPVLYWWGVSPFCKKSCRHLLSWSDFHKHPLYKLLSCSFAFGRVSFQWSAMFWSFWEQIINKYKGDLLVGELWRWVYRKLIISHLPLFNYLSSRRLLLDFCLLFPLLEKWMSH